MRLSSVIREKQGLASWPLSDVETCKIPLYKQGALTTWCITWPHAQVHCAPCWLEPRMWPIPDSVGKISTGISELCYLLPRPFSSPGSSLTNGFCEGDWVAYGQDTAKPSLLLEDCCCSCLGTKPCLSVTPWTAAHLHYPSLPCKGLSPRVCSNSCPLSQWCHPTISSFVALFYCPQSFLAAGSFPVSQLFISCCQSIGASALASVLPMNIRGWFPLGLTDLISLSLRDSQESSLAPQLESISSLVLSLLYGCPTLTSIHDYWKNHSFDQTDLHRQTDVPTFFFFFKDLLTWLWWAFAAAHRLSSCWERGLLFSCSAWASPCRGLSCCRAQALGCAGYGSRGGRAPECWHVRSSQARDWNGVLCIARWILNPWTTREA